MWNVFWMLLALVGVVCCSIHFAGEHPGFLAGRAVDGAMGAAMLVNAIVFWANLYEFMTGGDEDD